MTLPLATPIATYFKISNGAQFAHVKDCFAPKAIVADENHTHTGHSAIEAWLRNARERYAYTSVPLRVVEDGGITTVTAMVSGDFPGSPLELTYSFRHDGKRISALEIA